MEKPKGLMYWDGNEIVEGLLLGSVRAVQRETAMEYYGINAVLSILTDPQINIHDELEEYLKSHSISKEEGNWLRFDFADAALQNNIQSELHSAADFINHHMSKNDQSDTRQSVMVHCWAGMSRSPTMVTAYLMKYKPMSCDEALQFVNAQRKEAHPKPYFLEQLLLFEKKLTGQSSCCVIL